jgi:hypothetical protein
MPRTRELMHQFLTSGDIQSTERLVTSICLPQTITLETLDFLNISNSEAEDSIKPHGAWHIFLLLKLKKFDLLHTNSFKFYSNRNFEKPSYYPKKTLELTFEDCFFFPYKKETIVFQPFLTLVFILHGLEWIFMVDKIIGKKQ